VSSSPRRQKLTLNPFGLTLQTGYPHSTSLVLSLVCLQFFFIFKRMKFWLLCFLKGNFAKNVTRCWFWMIICQKKRKESIDPLCDPTPINVSSIWKPNMTQLWMNHNWVTYHIGKHIRNESKKETIIFLYSWLPTYWKLS
jgi:hypothetical protein